MLLVLTTLLLSIFILGAIHYHIRGRKGRILAQMPGPSGWPIVGVLPSLLVPTGKPSISAINLIFKQSTLILDSNLILDKRIYILQTSCGWWEETWTNDTILCTNSGSQMSWSSLYSIRTTPRSYLKNKFSLFTRSAYIYIKLNFFCTDHADKHAKY